jgi:methylmalonyl-CoA mutase
MEEQWKKLAEQELKNLAIDSLNWQTTDNFSLSPLYTTLSGSETSFPGIPPYTRGVRATMYTNRPWTIRQYAGFSSAKATNAFYHDC